MLKKNQWTKDKIKKLFELPFLDLLFKAHRIHRKNFSPNHIQLSKLLSIKTGACPEDCAYCPQSAHYPTQLTKQKLMNLDEILIHANLAKKQGATRFCMGAAWRNPPQKDFPKIINIIREVKKLGIETCVTLGMLNEMQAQELKGAGLDFYNHNLDTSPEHYQKIITTRTYQDRLDTLNLIRHSQIKTCCGGIIGMGETREDRIQFILQLTLLEEPPKSVPINQLIPIPGTPLADEPPLDPLEFIRTVAIARITMPHSMVRLSAGRDRMSDETHALCFYAGANSIFLGDVLLTAPNSSSDRDLKLLQKLGLRAMQCEPSHC